MKGPGAQQEVAVSNKELCCGRNLQDEKGSDGCQVKIPCSGSNGDLAAGYDSLPQQRGSPDSRQTRPPSQNSSVHRPVSR